jgi:hypothetical protein
MHDNDVTSGRGVDKEEVQSTGIELRESERGRV